MHTDLAPLPTANLFSANNRKKLKGCRMSSYITYVVPLMVGCQVVNVLPKKSSSCAAMLYHGN
jgi:hypothetical protein